MNYKISNPILFFPIFIIVSSAMFISGCNKNDDDNNTTANCKSTKYIITENGFTTTGFWVYDNQGRVTKDSIPATPDATWLINYVGNVVNASDGYGKIISVQLNSNGFPTQSTAAHSITATYNSDGTLQKVRCVYNANETYLLDNVVYSGGNIVSYSITDSFSTSTVIDYTCTYFTDKEYYTPYNPTAKIFSLFGRYINASDTPFQDFTPQPFSKNVLKQVTVSLPSAVRNFSYQYDSNGNITNITDDRGIEKWYEYSCQ